MELENLLDSQALESRGWWGVQKIYETSFRAACSAKEVEILKNLKNDEKVNYWGWYRSGDQEGIHK